jgi:hypothetical protein
MIMEQIINRKKEMLKKSKNLRPMTEKTSRRKV